MCDRCRKTIDLEGGETFDVGFESIQLCARCTNTFWRRFRKFIAGG